MIDQPITLHDGSYIQNGKKYYLATMYYRPQTNGSTLLTIHEHGNMMGNKINLSPDQCRELGEALIKRAENLKS